MSDKPTPDIGHLKWAIDQRAKIQHTLLALYAYVRDTEAAEEPEIDNLADALIAAAFCLWRALFLADLPRSDESVRQAQRNFLATVLSTNAITFGDDRTNRSWSVGFYLDAAAARIWSIIDFLNKVNDGDYDSSEVTPYLSMITDDTVPSTRRTWEGLHAAVRVLYVHLAYEIELPVEAPQDVDDPL